MTTNLYDAHRQWALRPPDERFPTQKETPEVVELQEIKFGSGGED